MPERLRSFGFDGLPARAFRCQSMASRNRARTSANRYAPWSMTAASSRVEPRSWPGGFA